MYVEWIILIIIISISIIIKKKVKNFTTNEIVIIAMLAALASAVRVVLVAVPNAKPTSFIIIMTGVLIGPEAGFIVGCLIPLISNLFLGIGPWLPWQMLLWGIMGLTSVSIKDKSKLIQVSYGFIWGMIFGWVMNLWYYTTGVISFSLRAYFLSCIYSFSFDVIHGITNAILLFVFPIETLKSKITINH